MTKADEDQDLSAILKALDADQQWDADYDDDEADSLWANAILDDSRASEVGHDVVELVEKLPYGYEELIPGLVMAIKFLADRLPDYDWVMGEVAELLDEGVEDEGS